MTKPLTELHDCITELVQSMGLRAEMVKRLDIHIRPVDVVTVTATLLVPKESGKGMVSMFRNFLLVEKTIVNDPTARDGEGNIDSPAWDSTESKHDWRNHVPDRVRSMWNTFSLTQRQAIFEWAFDLDKWGDD